MDLPDDLKESSQIFVKNEHGVKLEFIRIQQTICSTYM